ncbi:glycosyltransferase family 4 protein [Lichenicoccus sp.]|uniref:glycosyltransferase family 4 protein n=1 Tax=Lichenicoccus sp. TaxID=2781899 RepID=UPI003D136B6B
MTATNLFSIGSGWFPERRGGAENMFFHLFEGLPAQGFAVRGVVPGSGDVQRQTSERMRGFAVAGTSLARRALALRRSARDSFAQARPDLVASHFALYSLPLLDRISGLPLVAHFHGPWALESALEGAGLANVRVKRALERVAYRRADRVIVLSQAFARLAQAQYGVADSAIRCVPGGVDCDRFAHGATRAQARAALGWDADRPVVFAVRRLVKRMGLDRLLDAMAPLRRTQAPGTRDVVLHIAGTGPERRMLERHAAERGLSDAVCFEGAIDQDRLALCYRAADVTLVPTAGLEGFGLVAIESLAAGTPVLVTPVGGLPEVVSGLSGAMVLGGSDGPSIASGIAAFLDGSSGLPNAAACQEYARRHFDWRVVTPQVASVYREVL